MKPAPRQAHELSRIAARHGPLDVRASPAGGPLVELPRGYLRLTVALGPDGRAVATVWTAVPDKERRNDGQ